MRTGRSPWSGPRSAWAYVAVGLVGCPETGAPPNFDRFFVDAGSAPTESVLGTWGRTTTTPTVRFDERLRLDPGRLTQVLRCQFLGDGSVEGTLTTGVAVLADPRPDELVVREAAESIATDGRRSCRASVTVGSRRYSLAVGDGGVTLTFLDVTGTGPAVDPDTGALLRFDKVQD